MIIDFIDPTYKYPYFNLLHKYSLVCRKNFYKINRLRNYKYEICKMYINIVIRKSNTSQIKIKNLVYFHKIYKDTIDKNNAILMQIMWLLRSIDHNIEYITMPNNYASFFTPYDYNMICRKDGTIRKCLSIKFKLYSSKSFR